MVGRDRQSVYQWEAGTATPNVETLRVLVEKRVLTANQALGVGRGKGAA
jgi:hypothetical protein